jgi:hypothetical protein
MMKTHGHLSIGKLLDRMPLAIGPKVPVAPSRDDEVFDQPHQKQQRHRIEILNSYRSGAALRDC